MDKPTPVQVIFEKADVKRLKQIALDDSTSLSEMIRKLVKEHILTD